MRLAEIDNGIVTNVILVDPARRPDWTRDWPEAGQAGPGWRFDGAAFAPPAEGASRPTGAEVDAERDRRLRKGTIVELDGIGRVPIEGREVDTRNLQGLVTAAQLRLAAGDATTLTPFRDAENVVHRLTPPQIVALWQGGAGYVSALFEAAWTLKDDPAGIPADYRHDAHWP